MVDDNCGNPRLRDWMKEWMDSASGLQSKAYYTYKKAYDSLSRCPVPFSHPSETKSLEGIGEGLAGKLTKRLEEYCKEEGLPMPEPPRKTKKSNGSNDIEDFSTPVRKTSTKAYIPGLMTGGYGIMIALMEYHEVNRENITKEQICRVAENHCTASYKTSLAGKSYTAWNSMKTLEKNGYVYKNGRPAKYCLTETGVELAKKLKETRASSGVPMPSVNIPISAPSANTERLTNPSTARGSQRKGTNQSLDELWEQYGDDASSGPDMSMYLLNPSQHQSNNETSSSVPEPDILHALANASRSNTGKRKGNGRAPRTNNYKRQRGTKLKSNISAVMDKLIAEYDDGNNGLDMSSYVLNPQDYGSITLGTTTVHNKPTNATPATTPASTQYSDPSGGFIRPVSLNKPSTSRFASSITSSNNPSFARSVLSAQDDDMDGLLDYGRSSTMSNGYSTPSNSKILQADTMRRSTSKTKKPSYNVDDYDVDLSPPFINTTFDTPPSSSLFVNSQKDDIVDLLSSPEPSPIIRPTKVDTVDDFDIDTDYFPLSQARTKKIQDDTFHYTYLDANDNEVRSAAQAAFAFDDDTACFGFRIRFYNSQLSHPIADTLKKLQKDNTHDGCTIGYIADSQKDPICLGLPAKPLIPLHREELDNFWPEENITNNSTRDNYSDRMFISSQNSQPMSSQPLQSQTQTQAPDYSHIVETEHLEQLLPNEYEIVVVLDSREIQAQNDRNYFQRKLIDKGINLITRSLDLGDVIWIARKVGSKNQSDELFLDYILERKRLDDLVSSIRDGRFVEQKTRLKRSGAEKVMYVVEEYNKEDAVRFGWQACQTAMSSTQIVDGFFLKRTYSVDETIEYIVSVTKLIQRIYKETTLYSIPGHIITRQNYLNLKDAFKAKTSTTKASYLVSYPLFSDLNTKNGSTSLHEIYLRMLLTIKGVNAERALSLIQIYPTPYSLLKAFHGKSLDQVKTMMKNATQHHISRRKWGPTQIEKLYGIWAAIEYSQNTTDSQ